MADGLVVTNAHNLRDRTTLVTFADGRSVQGRATGIDVDGDLSVLAVDTGGVPALAWADSPADLGLPVYAVATLPGGRRVTAGRVSAVDRSFRGPRGGSSRAASSTPRPWPGAARAVRWSTPPAAWSASPPCGWATASP